MASSVLWFLLHPDSWDVEGSFTQFTPSCEASEPQKPDVPPASSMCVIEGVKSTILDRPML